MISDICRAEWNMFFISARQNCNNLEIPLSEDLRFTLKKKVRYDTMIKK